MRLFDALIGNIDRNLGNQLVGRSDGKLHLIDHSRSFRVSRTLSDSFLIRSASLPRELYERLRLLDADALWEQLRGLISRQQLRRCDLRHRRVACLRPSEEQHARRRIEHVGD